MAYKELVENHFQQRIGTLFSKNGGEFLALKSYLQVQGISHLTSPPHTPEHNSAAERKHRRNWADSHVTGEDVQDLLAFCIRCSRVSHQSAPNTEFGV